MKKLLFTLLMVISASAFSQREYQVSSCSFHLTSSYKKDKFSITAGWSNAFQAEGRQGWGLDMRKLSDAEAYIGEVALESGHKLEVTAIVEGNKLTVKGAITQTLNGVTKNITQGEQVVEAAGPFPLSTKLEIENPFITNIKKTLRPNEYTTDSKLFPEGVLIYEGVEFHCQAF